MLRHTAAALSIETGVDIRFMQRLLGHSSIAATEIYTHVSDEALRATLNVRTFSERLRRDNRPIFQPPSSFPSRAGAGND